MHTHLRVMFIALAEFNVSMKMTVFPDSDPGSIQRLIEIGTCMDSQSSWERLGKVIRQQQHPCQADGPAHLTQPETRHELRQWRLMQINPKPETDHIYRIVLLLLLPLLIFSCASPEQPAAVEPEGAPWFVESSEQLGLAFQHVRAEEVQYHFPEIMSGGAAWIDYDGDGFWDLYVVQGGSPAGAGANTPGNRLYRNVGGTRFEDVTESAGVGDNQYGMGASVGDYDNDGDLDLYVTNVGANVLYRNEGDGRFVDVTEAADVGHPGWGTSSVFADYNGDGLLDLYVVNYILWSPEREMECTTGGAGRDYCHPDNYNAPAVDVLYQNMGNGRFEDVTASAGINTVAANGLGIVEGDFNGDNLTDFYVANDGNPNQYWVNNGDGTFTDRAVLSGTAVNRQGAAEAGMGVVAFDAEQDGDLDLFMTHLRGETNTLYRNTNGVFQDVTAAQGLAAPSISLTGFGVGAFDFNQDGYEDLYVANGRVGRSGVVEGDPFAEPNLLFLGHGPGGFEEVKPTGGTTAELVATSRAAAFADYDNDGDIDIAVVNNGGDLYLLQNVVADARNWIGLVIESEAGRIPVGARVAVHVGTETWWRWIRAGGSYQASNDLRVHVGVGVAPQVDSVRVTLKDGQAFVFKELDVNQYHTLTVGTF